MWKATDANPRRPNSLTEDVDPTCERSNAGGRESGLDLVSAGTAEPICPKACGSEELP